VQQGEKIAVTSFKKKYVSLFRITLIKRKIGIFEGKAKATFAANSKISDHVFLVL